MDETNKFLELKALKDAQQKVLVKGVLEQQIEADRKKKAKDERERRGIEGQNTSYGPGETPETMIFGKLKR